MKPVFLVSLFLGSLALSDEERCPKNGLAINLKPGDVQLLEPIIKDRYRQIFGKWIAAPEWKPANASYRMVTRPHGCSKPFQLQIHVMSNNIQVEIPAMRNFSLKCGPDRSRSSLPSARKCMDPFWFGHQLQKDLDRRQ